MSKKKKKKYTNPRPEKKYLVLMYLRYEGWVELADFETKAEAVARIQQEVDTGIDPSDYMLVAPLSWSVNIGGNK